MRLTRAIRGAVALAVVVSASGCALTFDARGTGVPVLLSNPAGQKTPGTPFTVTRHATYAFWGLASVSHPSLGKMLEAQLLGAQGIADVRVRVRSRWSDILFTVITAGIIVPRTVTVEGTVVGAPADTTTKK
jgi:hypothetical protein